MVGTTPPPSWPTPPPPAPVDAEALRRYDALTPAERAAVARLVAVSGAPLGLAVSAIESLRTRP